jgi:prepilin-type N-terminal cleavage/methylation domain-containing protein
MFIGQAKQHWRDGVLEGWSAGNGNTPLLRHSIIRAKERDSAFTLIEITLAVAILSMMSLAIYRFVQTNITALRVASEATINDDRFGALRDLLNAQLQSLPPGSGALLGDTLKLNDRRRDEIKWVCGAGPGLLTRYAGGDFLVTMKLQRHKSDDAFDLGFVRAAKGEDAEELDEPSNDWIPLLKDVRSLEIRYFDPRLNTWLDRWNDTVTLPRLVKIIIGRGDTAVPWEVIIPLGRTPL